MKERQREVTKKIISAAAVSAFSLAGCTSAKPSEAPNACRQIDVAAHKMASYKEYLIMNGLPQYQVEIVNGKTKKHYKISPLETGTSVILPKDTSLIVVFGENGLIEVDINCTKPSDPSILDI
jgi:phospholipase C